MGRVLAASICTALCLAASACNRSDTPAEPAQTVAASASPSPAPVAAAPSVAPGATAEPQCASLCRSTLALHCSKAAACVDNCQTMVAQSGACSEPMRAVLACFSKQQQSSWECDEDGNAAIKDGFCDAEQAAFARCAQSH